MSMPGHYLYICGICVCVCVHKSLKSKQNNCNVIKLVKEISMGNDACITQFQYTYLINMTCEIMTCDNNLLFQQEKYHSKNDYFMYEFIMFIELATLTGHVAQEGRKTFSNVPKGFYSSISISSALPGENSFLI